MNVNREDVIVSAFSSILLEELSAEESFNSLEEFGVTKALNLLCRSFERALEAYDEAIFQEGDSRFASKEFKSRFILTTAGSVVVNRRRYSSKDGSVYLLDEAIDLPERVKVSPQLSRMAAIFATNASYQESANALEYYIADKLSKMTIARQLEQNAELLKKTENTKPEEKIHTPVLDVEADGCFVPLQRTRAQKEADKAGGKKKKKAHKEVRVFSAYSGKEAVAHKGKKRCNVTHFATTKPSKEAWEEFSARLEQKYSTQDVFYVNLACDGESSYLAGAKYLPGSVSCGYDLHHIPTKLAGVFGRDIAHEVYSTMKGLGFREGYDILTTYADHLFEQTGDNKYRDITAFFRRHKRDMQTAFIYNLGTIEGTIAHIIGSRCKRFGGGWGPRLDAVSRLRAGQASGIRPALAHRKRTVDLPKITKARELADIESYIAALEQRARANRSRQDSKQDVLPEYYHQAPIAHRSKNERCHSLLRHWA